jgi:hypothetical protein
MNVLIADGLGPLVGYEHGITSAILVFGGDR